MTQQPKPETEIQRLLRERREDERMQKMLDRLCPNCGNENCKGYCSPEMEE